MFHRTSHRETTRKSKTPGIVKGGPVDPIDGFRMPDSCRGSGGLDSPIGRLHSGKR